MGWAKRKVISGLAITEQIIVTEDAITIKKVEPSTHFMFPNFFNLISKLQSRILMKECSEELTKILSMMLLEKVSLKF